jgi:hypothetical protein
MSRTNSQKIVGLLGGNVYAEKNEEADPQLDESLVSDGQQKAEGGRCPQVRSHFSFVACGRPRP